MEAGNGAEGTNLIIVSAPDHKGYVYRNGVEIGRAPVGGIEAARLSGTPEIGTYLTQLGRTGDPSVAGQRNRQNIAWASFPKADRE